MASTPDTDAIDELLPQTQCERCGYPGCRPYAEALARGDARINQCPPGGQAGVDALARLLNIPSIPLDTTRGETKPNNETAVIIEADCIGCTRCIRACPVDAIVGAAKLMHTVIEAECTGCELCLPVCPVDCIDMVPLPAFGPGEHAARRERARTAFGARNRRLARRREERERARQRRQTELTAARRRKVIADVVKTAREQTPSRRRQDTGGSRGTAVAAAIARAKAARERHGNE